MIQPYPELVGIIVDRLSGEKDIGSAVGLRKKTQKSLRQRIDERQLVVMDGLVREYMERLSGRVTAHPVAIKLFRRGATELAKIPLPLGEGWNCASLGFSLPVAETQIGRASC